MKEIGRLACATGWRIAGGAICLFIATVAIADDADFTSEIWGRADYGDGYIYGPALRSTGVTVVDFDGDADNDFVLPGFSSPPQVMRNLGNDRAFFPGGPRDLNILSPTAVSFFDINMDFGDLNGDGRPDLAVVIDNHPVGKSSIALYRNDPGSPRENPTFEFIQYVYSCTRTGLGTIGPVNLADVNGDGRLDIFYIEYFLDQPTDGHRLFRIFNSGTTSVPVWGAPIEVTALSSLLPDLVPVGGKKPPSLLGESSYRGPSRDVGEQKGIFFDAAVYDFQFADWDIDGDLDFMFYDSERGVDWVRNNRAAPTEQNPNPPASWDTILNRDGVPYSHDQSLGRIFGSFAIRQGPFYPDFYVAVQGRLQGWRYIQALGEYQLLQQSAVAMESGGGQPSFWDFDFDGDLDLFRCGIGPDAFSALVAIPNVGTPYAPIWGTAFVAPVNTANDGSVPIGQGSSANGFRQDSMTFYDADLDGRAEFFVQGQDGLITYYELSQGPLPEFAPINFDMGALKPAGLSNVIPRGMAFADFNADEIPDLVAVYGSSDGGRMIFAEQFHDPETEFIDGWFPPFDMTGFLLDEDDQELTPNRIESIAATDIDKDGRVDLVICYTAVNPPENPTYTKLTYSWYRNTLHQDNSFTFDYMDDIPAPTEMAAWGRSIGLADIDSDSDEDLFVAHQFLEPGQPNLSVNRYHFFNFYRNTGETFLEFVLARVVAGQSRSLDAEVFHFPVLDSSGMTLDNTNHVYTAGPISKVVDIVQTDGLVENIRYFVDVLPPVGAESKAVLVVGSVTTDPLYPVFASLAQLAYYSLCQQGLSKANIRLFAPGPIDGDFDGISDTFNTGEVTPLMLQQSITSWANDSDRLLVYLVDHGQRNKFRLNSVDYLSASTYAGWLDSLQNSVTPPIVTTVIDTCEAGSFIDELSLTKAEKKAGKQRITITSSDVGPTRGVALFDSVRGISFSLAFWSEILFGAPYGRAFDNAKVAIQSINPLQVPQIDDDGDGVANGASDGLFADQHQPGADFEQPAAGVFIGEIADPQSIVTDTATIWLSDVVSSFPVDGAGALIVPPNFERDTSGNDDEQPLSGFEWIDLDFNIDTNRWEGDFDKFDSGGLYRVQYYVSSLGRYFASPRIGFVDRIGTPDDWEADDTFGAANWLRVNSTQGHNFHTSSDDDWVRFFAPNNQTATIAVLSPGPNCKPKVELYKKSDLDANGNAAAILTKSAEEPGDDIVVNRLFVAGETYYLRVSNQLTPQDGGGTSYLLLIAVDTGGVIPPTLVAKVVQSGTSTALSGVTVQSNGNGLGPFNSTTTGDGIAQFTCPGEGSYTVTATKSGYQQASQVVQVNNQVEAVTLNLVPNGVATVQATLSANRPGVTATVDGAQYSLPQTFTWAKDSVQQVSVPDELSGGYLWDKWSDSNAARTRAVSFAANGTLTANFKSSAGSGDVNSDGSTNAVDVQLVINGALGINVPYNTDLNGDGDTTAVDIQMVINAALGI